jgi:hypothetical protein
MNKSGVDKGLLGEAKSAATRMLELGKSEADIVQLEARSRQAKRFQARRAELNAREARKVSQQGKVKEKEAEAREQQGIKVANAATQQRSSARIRSGGSSGIYSPSEDQEESTLNSALVDSNQPAGAPADLSGRDGPSEAERGIRDEAWGIDSALDGSEEALEATESVIDSSLGDEEFFIFMEGERRRKRSKRRDDGSLITLEEVLEEGLSIDQINILDFIQDPTLLKFFTIATNRQLGEIRQRYGEDAVILWTITELARAVMLEGLREKGLNRIGTPLSLRRARTPTEEAVAEACRGALVTFVN